VRGTRLAVRSSRHRCARPQNLSRQIQAIRAEKLHAGADSRHEPIAKSLRQRRYFRRQRRGQLPIPSQCRREASGAVRRRNGEEQQHRLVRWQVLARQKDYRKRAELRLQNQVAARESPAQQQEAEEQPEVCHDIWREIRPGEGSALPPHCRTRRKWASPAGDGRSPAARDRAVRTREAGRRDFPGRAGHGRDFRSHEIHCREIRHPAVKHIWKAEGCGHLH